MSSVLFTTVLMVLTRVLGTQLVPNKYKRWNECMCVWKKLENPKYSPKFVKWQIVQSLRWDYTHNAFVLYPSTSGWWQYRCKQLGENNSFICRHLLYVMLIWLWEKKQGLLRFINTQTLKVIGYNFRMRMKQKFSSLYSIWISTPWTHQKGILF